MKVRNCTEHADNKECAIMPKINFSFVAIGGEWNQQDPINLDKKFHRGAVIGDDFVAIGATDGTLMFLKLDPEKRTLTVHSSNDIHKGCINDIYNEQSRHTFIASSDGIVTVWDPSPTGPVLVQTVQFPEEILFVCDSPSAHLVAANAHKIYIADLKLGKVIKEEKVNETITGLFGNNMRVDLATKDQFYTLVHENFEAPPKVSVIRRTPSVIAMPTPNFWTTPDASFRAVILPDEVQCFLLHEANLFKRFSCPNSAKFDARAGVLKYNPVRYWLTVSTGTNIVTYDLENSTKAMLASVSPRISRSEIDAGRFPICDSLWYSLKGDFLFGLYSNNTLCWWHLPYNAQATPAAVEIPPPNNSA